MFSGRRKITVASVVIDILLYIILSVITLLLSYNKLGLKPFHRGFFCDDDSLKYPYRSDSVPDDVVAIVSILVPVVVMFIVEGIHLFTSKERRVAGTRNTCKSYAVTMYRTAGVFLFGLLFSTTVMEVTKMVSGRLRPHFFAVCQPDFSRINCADGFVTISDDYCNATDRSKFADARKSFPSGHASLSSFGMLYLIIYLQVRFIWKKASKAFLPIVQCALTCVAIYFSVSRVNDNKHHATDVIAGAVLGTVTCLLTIKYASDLPKCITQCESDDDQENAGKNAMVSTVTMSEVTSSPQVVLEMNDDKRL